MNEECARIRDAIQVVLDERLDPSCQPRTARSEVDSHVERCADCREELEILGRLEEALEGLPTREPPTRMWQALAARIEADRIVEATPPAWSGLLEAVRRTLSPLAPVLAAGAAVWYLTVHSVLPVRVAVWQRSPVPEAGPPILPRIGSEAVPVLEGGAGFATRTRPATRGGSSLETWDQLQREFGVYARRLRARSHGR